MKFNIKKAMYYQAMYNFDRSDLREQTLPLFTSQKITPMHPAHRYELGCTTIFLAGSIVDGLSREPRIFLTIDGKVQQCTVIDIDFCYESGKIFFYVKKNGGDQIYSHLPSSTTLSFVLQVANGASNTKIMMRK